MGGGEASEMLFVVSFDCGFAGALVAVTPLWACPCVVGPAMIACGGTLACAVAVGKVEEEALEHVSSFREETYGT